MKLPRFTLVLLAAAAVFAAAGCSSAAGEPSATPTPAMPDRAPDPNQRCGFKSPTEKVTLTSSDGVKIAGAEAGTGARGIVLLHQHGDNLCGWGANFDLLVDKGFHVLAIDLRCSGYSDCDREWVQDDMDGTYDYAGDAGAAIAYLHEAGAAKVVVMGASLGAATAVVAGGRFADQVSGVVGLSVFSAGFNASANNSDVRTPTDAAAKMVAPMLIVVATADSATIHTASAEQLISKGAAKDRSSVVVRSGSFQHGWEQLGDKVVLKAVLEFLTANT